MKKLKKLILVALAVFMTFGFSACLEKENGQPQPEETYNIVYVGTRNLNNENPTTYKESSDTIVLKNLEDVEGYTFAGWFEEDTFETKIEKIEKGSVGNRTLYAKFDAVTYSISYVLNSGTNSLSNPDSYTIETEAITFADATKNGYTFAGWFEEDTFETRVERIERGSTGNKTLYAKFDAVTYSISYVLNGGTNSLSNPSSYTIETEAITFADATKAGYTFAGWFEEDTFETRVERIERGSTGNKTLYAKFDAVTYSISYVLNGGTNNSKNLKVFTAEDLPVKLNNPTCGIKRFLSWTADGKVITEITKIGNVTVTANWDCLGYTLSDDGKYYIVSSFNECEENVVIPNEYNGLPVKEIAASVFQNCDDLKNVVIGENVTTIGDNAFYSCGGLTSLILPNKVTTIKKEAFYYCYGLTSITIPSTVTVIEEDAFKYCKKLVEVRNLSKLNIQKGSTDNGQVGYSAIAIYTSNEPTKLVKSNGVIYYVEGSNKIAVGPENPDITRIVLDNDCTEVNSNAFYYNGDVISVVIPSSVKTIGDDAFYIIKGTEIYNLSSLNIQVGATTNGEIGYYSKVVHTSLSEPSRLVTNNGVVYYVNGSEKIAISLADKSLTSVTLDSNCTAIDEKAFYQCKNLTSVTIPEGVKTIGRSAFEYTSIDTVVIPSSVTSIDDYAFTGCFRLREIYNLSSLDIQFGSYNNGNVGYYARIIHTSLNEPQRLVISNGVKYYINGSEKIAVSPVDMNATEIVIDNDCTSIDKYAFSYCKKLVNITIPNSVKTMESGVFSYCSNLVNVTIPSSVTNFGSYMFYRCRNLTSIEIPSSVTNLAGFTFQWCFALTNVTLPSNLVNIAGYDFIGCCALKNITIPNTVTSIGESAFLNCISLTEIAIPNGVTNIGGSAFNNCYSLTEITIPNTVTSIGRYVFRDCKNLQELVVPFVGQNATEKKYFGHFFDASRVSNNAKNLIPSLRKVTITQDTEISDNMFMGWICIEEIVLPNTVSKIGNNAFLNCTSLKKINLPKSITSIGTLAFSGCTSLEILEIKNSVTTIGKSALSGCKNLKELSIPFVGGTSSENMFLGYIFGASSYSENSQYVPQSLKVVSVTFAKTIADYAFNGCNYIQNVNLEATVESIGNYAFENCKSLKTMSVPESVTTIGKSAFANCESLEQVSLNCQITALQDLTFAYCSNLRHVDFGSKLTSIGNEVFSGCLKMTTSKVYGSAAANAGSSAGVSAVGESSNRFEIPTTVTSIGSGAFRGCKSLQEMAVPFIGGTATNNAYLGYIFGASSYEENIERIPASLKKLTVTKANVISFRALYNCKSLVSLTLYSCVRRIESNAFTGCDKLVEIYNLSNLNIECGSWENGNVGAYAKDVYKSLDCESKLKTSGGVIYYVNGSTKIAITLEDINIKDVVIDSDCSYLANYAFFGCGMQSITIPSGVITLGNGTFYNCENLKNVTINSTTILNFLDYLFYNCSSLESVTFPSKLISIGRYTFSGCYKLKSIVLPEKVELIEEFAFSRCRNLESITIGKVLTSVEVSAFQNCSSLKTVYYKGSSSEWNNIQIADDNSYLTDCTKYYNQ